jgi:hypothetical protein
MVDIEAKIPMMRLGSLLTLLLASLFTSGAAAQGAYSGFIHPYPALEPAGERAGALVYRKAGADLGKYDKVAIDPVEIWIHPDPQYKGIAPDEMKALTDAFRQILVETPKPDYPAVGKPGTGVLHVRLAITNVKVADKKRSLLGYTPIGFATTTVMNAAGLRTTLKEATVEAELLDAVSGEQLGVLIDSLGAGNEAPESSWDAVQQTLRFYAQRFRQRLDAAHGG